MYLKQLLFNFNKNNTLIKLSKVSLQLINGLEGVVLHMSMLYNK